MTRSRQLSETLKWEGNSVYDDILVPWVVFLFGGIIDLFLCLSGSSFGSEILDGVSLREAEETELFFGTHGCLERNATIWGISGNGTEHSKCVTCT